jgi:hypothetical protein
LVMGTLENYNLSYSENMKEWVDVADYYTSPVSNNIIYFPSIPSLVEFLSNKSQFHHTIQQLHPKISSTNTIRIHSIYESWNHILHFRFFNFICYNFWPCLAKHHLDGDYSNEPECPILYKYNALVRLYSFSFLSMSKIQYISPETKENIFHGLDRLSKTQVKTSDLCNWLDWIH